MIIIIIIDDNIMIYYWVEIGGIVVLSCVCLCACVCLSASVYLQILSEEEKQNKALCCKKLNCEKSYYGRSCSRGSQILYIGLKFVGTMSSTPTLSSLPNCLLTHIILFLPSTDGLPDLASTLARTVRLIHRCFTAAIVEAVARFHCMKHLEAVKSALTIQHKCE